MKWILYAVSAITLFLGIGTTIASEAVFQQTAGIILLLIGTTSFGFAVVVGRLDQIVRLLATRDEN